MYIRVAADPAAAATPIRPSTFSAVRMFVACIAPLWRRRTAQLADARPTQPLDIVRRRLRSAGRAGARAPRGGKPAPPAAGRARRRDAARPPERRGRR